MDNEIVYSSKATDQKAQYDACAKRLLGQKIILAHILIREKCVLTSFSMYGCEMDWQR